MYCSILFCIDPKNKTSEGQSYLDAKRITNRKRLTDVLNLSYVNTERLTCTFQIIKDNLTGNADDEVMTNLSSNDPGFHELF